MGADQEESPRCNHQVRVAEGGRAEPSLVCDCPAGLIHMYDCPVTLGLRCIHFGDDGFPPEAVEVRVHAELHERLMADYLSRVYAHRVRSLDPNGDDWHRRQVELAMVYEAFEPEADDAPDEVSEAYERERERLLKIRRKREEQRQAREEEEKRARAARARAHAERLAREAERRAAARARQPRARPKRQPAPEGAGGAPGGGEGPPKRRRRRRSKPRGAGAPEGLNPAASEGRKERPGGDESKPRTRRRRRRRRKPQQGGDASA